MNKRLNKPTYRLLLPPTDVAYHRFLAGWFPGETPVVLQLEKAVGLFLIKSNLQNVVK